VVYQDSLLLAVYGYKGVRGQVREQRGRPRAACSAQHPAPPTRASPGPSNDAHVDDGPSRQRLAGAKRPGAHAQSEGQRGGWGQGAVMGCGGRGEEGAWGHGRRSTCPPPPSSHPASRSQSSTIDFNHDGMVDELHISAAMPLAADEVVTGVTAIAWLQASLSVRTPHRCPLL